LWFIQWRLEASFWWIIWIQLAQIYTLLPLRLALPGAMLIFVITAGFENGFHQFSTISLPDKVGRHIPWVVFSSTMSHYYVFLIGGQNLCKGQVFTETANYSG
jgi:hypothetical protein